MLGKNDIGMPVLATFSWSMQAAEENCRHSKCQELAFPLTLRYAEDARRMWVEVCEGFQGLNYISIKKGPSASVSQIKTSSTH